MGWNKDSRFWIVCCPGDALLPEEATVIFLQTGTIRITNEALKYMGKDQGGHGGVIVHTASIGGGSESVHCTQVSLANARLSPKRLISLHG